MSKLMAEWEQERGFLLSALHLKLMRGSYPSKAGELRQNLGSVKMQTRAELVRDPFPSLSNPAQLSAGLIDFHQVWLCLGTLAAQRRSCGTEQELQALGLRAQDSLVTAVKVLS